MHPLLWGVFGPFILVVAVAAVVGIIHLVRWLTGRSGEGPPDQG